MTIEKGITVQQMSDELRIMQELKRLRRGNLEGLRERMNLDGASLEEVQALLAEQASAGCVDNYKEIDTG